MFLESITFRVAGVTFNNDDGTSRQRYISKFDSFERLFLVPFEHEGSPAFYVVDCYDHCIGTLPKEYIGEVLEHQKQGHDMKLCVSEILGKDEDGHRISGYNLGVEASIDFFDDLPEPEEEPCIESHVSDTPATSSPKENRKTGRVMIGFGVFFALGFFVAYNPVVLIVSVLLLYFGVRRHKNFKNQTK